VSFPISRLAAAPGHGSLRSAVFAPTCSRNTNAKCATFRMIRGRPALLAAARLQLAEYAAHSGMRVRTNADLVELMLRIGLLRRVEADGQVWWRISDPMPLPSERLPLSSSQVALEDGVRWQRQTLSERLTSDHVRGDENFDLRLPVDVQQAYASAGKTNLFSRFDGCQTFDTDGESVTSVHSYLFGVQDFGRLGACHFLIDDWDGLGG
jgi:Family of unknown function (DUF6042)